MKKWVYLVFVTISFFSCSPKYIEYNDHGFGGGLVIKQSRNHELNENKTSNYRPLAEIDLEDTRTKQAIKNRVVYSDVSQSQLPFCNPTNILKPEQKKSPKKNQLFLNISKLQKSQNQQNLIPNKQSSFFRWYFFISGIIILIGTIILIADLTGPGAGPFEAIIAVLTGITGISGTIIFLRESTLIDKFLRNRCLLTKVAVVIWFLVPISLPLYIIGIIYDYFKNGIKFK